ncbi:MAG: hypothetical protein HQL12_02615 [Candidatus Omnitrophica bacterium]|nr:hypothetical protein [Candidatus Omnitrophota bacterium]
MEAVLNYYHFILARMDPVNLIIGFIVVFFVVFLIFRIIKEKELGKYLLQYGEELEAEVKLIDCGYRRLYYRVEVSFQINGQTIVKRMSVYSFLNWFQGQAIGASRKFPVLVDPTNPNRFLFNIHKFELKETSDDSIQNFLEREKAENPDIEDDKDLNK